MDDSRTDNWIKALLALGMALGALLIVEMVAASSWWAIHYSRVGLRGDSGFVLQKNAPLLYGGKTLLGAAPWIGVPLLALPVVGFVVAVLTVGVEGFAKRGSHARILYAIGGVGVILTLIATQVHGPNEFWKLTGAWAGALVGWAIYLLTLYGLLSTRAAALESEARPDSSDG